MKKYIPIITAIILTLSFSYLIYAYQNSQNTDIIDTSSKSGTTNSTQITKLIQPDDSASTALAEICFGKTCIDAEMAVTGNEKALGLMNRTSMPQDHGMIFIYEDEAIRSFWMKNTLIPLDMIWVDSQNIIRHIENAVSCEKDPCRTYIPKGPAQYVIEVNSDFTNKHSIKIGDKVKIIIPSNT